LNASSATFLDAFTIDVEEHFQVSAFEGSVRREDWDSHPSRVEANTERLLDFLDEAQVKGTFFVLGWIAERRPHLLRSIAERGHELACHGYSHRLIYTQTPDQFREETLRAKRLIEDAGASPVEGYRAASFSVTARSLWATDVLAETGFVYDSSLYPIVHDRYGIPGAPRHPYILKTASGARLVEIPPSTVRIGGAVLPVAGGGYLRLYPLRLTRWAMRRIHEQDAWPVVIYVHPWELDPDQPRVHAPLVSRFRHYVGLRTTLTKLRVLAHTFRFAPMRQIVEAASSFPEVSLP
jgi:polysaccharide deacetylase family protein (PEP-CTERM system associated)